MHFPEYKEVYVRIKISSFVAAVVLFSGSHLAAQTAAPPIAIPEIVTSGRGEIRVTPDRATLLVSVESHGSTAAEVSSANAKITNATIQAAKTAIGPSDVITTQSFTVSPDYQKNKV